MRAQGLECLPIVFVPGAGDVGAAPTPATIAGYGARYGSDYLCFWAAGVMVVVLNTPLLCDGSGAAAEQEAHKGWLRDQLFLARNAAHQAIILGYDPLLSADAREAAVAEAGAAGTVAETGGGSRSNGAAEARPVLDPATRDDIVEQMHVSNVRAAFGGAWGLNARQHLDQPDPGNILHNSTELVSSARLSRGGDEEGDGDGREGGAGGAGDTSGGVRVVRVFERHLDHKFYRVGGLPRKVQLPDLHEMPSSRAHHFGFDDAPDPADADDDGDDDDGEDGEVKAPDKAGGRSEDDTDTVTRQLCLINEALGEKDADSGSSSGGGLSETKAT